jgi:hypothetical protein
MIRLLIKYVTANKALSKRRRAKKTRIRQEGVFTIKDAYNIISQIKVDKQIRRDKRLGERNQGDRNLTVRRCSTCGETSHKSRTCQDTITVQS